MLRNHQANQTTNYPSQFRSTESPAEEASPPCPPSTPAGPKTPAPPPSPPPARKQFDNFNMKPYKQNILLIGDSITNSLDTKVIAQAADAKITKVKAYSSVRDEVNNIAKQAAIFPPKIFTDVAQHELKKKQFELMMLQAGSVDITNLKTIENPTEHFEYFRQETVKSAENLFNVAVKSLKSKPSLKKVIIFKQIPRYDSTQVDPLQLKPALSQIFNNTLADLWIKCPLKDRIFVGTHNIDCHGAIREARYKCTRSGRFDGVHLYGSTGTKAYTNSVLNILRNACVISADCPPCPQFQYQNRNKQNNKKQCYSWTQDTDVRNNKVYSVPTQNRFDQLAGNQFGVF